MSTEKMREEFEAKYALPDGLYWCEQSGQYVGHPQFWLFTDRLEVWINSRAAIEVELPSHVREEEFDDYSMTVGYNLAIDSCANTIESLGLKVKP